MSSGLSHDPDCICGHSVHALPCEFCDCLTSAVNAAWSHLFDAEEPS